MGEERKEQTVEIRTYKYGMRMRPYDMYSQPKDGFVCVGKGGTVDCHGYYNFIYYINRLDKETAEHYDLDYLGVAYLNAEEWQEAGFSYYILKTCVD